MKTVIIPRTENPWRCVVNGIAFSYEPGTVQSVPDEVADIIDNINDLKPTEAKIKGEVGQVWTRTDDYEKTGWRDIPQTPAATKTSAGVVKMAEAVADATDETDIIDQFNALIASLVDAGVLEEYVPDDNNA